ncbi:MAG TPA: hypothetical protein VGM34_00655 [Chlamydiales bacterium]
MKPSTPKAGRSATASWRNEAMKRKIKKTEIDRMASAFEHEDAQKAAHFF